ncbi:uncharacterized protein LOC121403750 [Drosophila obscura]|uniref:uncharacterized protein LOC121403750 n=1 Tax=Drosophila obscura TaxID=7282 RepID=UPI001BB0F16A|nr:uncharacterized protein LOC121403750 [Drosophila obscura]XP_041449991.1 uncharacterized protein LOC121403750 [Drosophila obscura]
MTKLLPILFACYMHLFSSFSLLIFDGEAYEVQSYWGSLIFFLSMMDVLHGNNLLPKKSYRKSRLLKIIIETVFVFLISEITMAFFWTKLESTLDMILRLITETDATRLFLLEAITVGLSLFNWAMVSPATHPDGLYNFLSRTSCTFFVWFKELVGSCCNLMKSREQPKVRRTEIKGILKNSKNKR